MQMGFEEMPTNQSPDAAAMNQRFWICGNVWSVPASKAFTNNKGRFRNQTKFFLGGTKELDDVWRHFFVKGWKTL